MSGGSEHIDDLLNGLVGAVVGCFARCLDGGGVRAVVEAAVGERSAEPFREEQKQQRDLDAFCGETVGVAGAITLDQSVPLELAQVVAELVEAAMSVGEAEGGEDGRSICLAVQPPT
jgi:hypothetical protein